MATTFAPQLAASAQEDLRVQLKDQIARGHWGIGTKLPSIRKIAQDCGVTHAAVRKTFDQLASEGWLETRHGSGTYVSETAAILVGLTICEQSPAQTCFDPGTTFDTSTYANSVASVYELMRAVNIPLARRQSIICADETSETRWLQAVRAFIADHASTVPSLTDPAGMVELRQEIADWLRKTRAMSCRESDIIIVNGNQEAYDLIARMFIDPGQPAILEDPSETSLRLFLSACGAQFAHLSLDQSGIIASQLADLPQRSLMFLSPSCQYPTGAVLGKRRREQIIEWAQSSGSIVVEDDRGSEFTYESRLAPALHALDAHGRTIYIGSFDSAIPADWQLAFIVVPPAMRMPFMRAKALSTRCTSPLVQRLVLSMLRSGFIAEQIRKAQRALEQRRKLVIDELRQMPADLVSYTPSKGGCIQSVFVQSSLSDVTIAHLAREQGLDLTPISMCATTSCANGLVIDFGAGTFAQLRRIMTELRQIIETYPG